MACRLPRYLPGDWPIIRISFSQEALDGLDGVVERAAFGVGERGLPQATHPVGGIGAALEPGGHCHQPREPALAPVVCVRIAFDQPARLEELDAERHVT